MGRRWPLGFTDALELGRMILESGRSGVSCSLLGGTRSQYARTWAVQLAWTAVAASRRAGGSGADAKR